jgi:hypothetical protein
MVDGRTRLWAGNTCLGNLRIMRRSICATLAMEGLWLLGRSGVASLASHRTRQQGGITIHWSRRGGRRSYRGQRRALAAPQLSSSVMWSRATCGRQDDRPFRLPTSRTPAPMSLRQWAAILALIGVASCAARRSSVQDQAVPLRDALAAAQEFLTALEREDWVAATALVHGEALATFKAEYLELAKFTDSSGAQLRSQLEGQLRTLVALAPEMADALRADTLLAELRAPDNLALSAFGIVTVAELETLSEQEALRRWLQTRQAYTPAPRTILGSVLSADTLSFIVYRKHMGTAGRFGTAELRVMAVRRTPQGWRVMPPPSI